MTKAGLVLALLLALATASPGGAHAATSPLPSSTVSNSVSGAAIVQTALQYVGYRYTTVGNSPKTGFSCIGLVSYVYQSNGIPLPDGLDAALAYAPSVPFADLLPGDVLYFQNTVWPGLSHAAIYLGGGRFIHAEWYNRGVRISSFNDDPLDGNYWIGKYLGANRPWGGSPGVTIVPPASGAGAADAPTATASTTLDGTEAVVTAPSLNVRTGPSTRSAVQTVVHAGTSLLVLGESAGWDQVQLSDGSRGWVVASALSTGGAAAPLPSASVPSSTPVSAPLVPVPVSALRVHTAASLVAPVIAVLLHGQKVALLSKGKAWDQIRTASGAIGWVSAPLLTPAPPPAPHRPTTLVALRVHSAPLLSARVIAVLPAHTPVMIVSHRGSWLTIRLTDSTAGYVVARYIK